MISADMTPTQCLPHLSFMETKESEAAATRLVVVSRFAQLKGLLEPLLGVLLLIPALPVICVLVVIIRLNSRGPGIFSQKRVGKNGRVFTMFKLRSMRLDAEVATGPVWANVVHDPRVTRLGYWLRRLHLDELPQLFNVAKGDMSLVGPRPERPEFVSVLSEQIPGYWNRLTVQPGITGLAQVNLPPDTDLTSVRKKLLLDEEYVATASFWLDFRIVLATLLRLVGVRGGRAVQVLGLHRVANVPEVSSAAVTGSAELGAAVHAVARRESDHDSSSRGHRRRLATPIADRTV